MAVEKEFCFLNYINTMLKQVRIHHTNLIHDQDIGLFQCITFMRKNRIVIFLYRDREPTLHLVTTHLEVGASA